MARELTNQQDPLDANMEKVLPSLHQWHRINNEEMSRLKQSLCEKVDDLAAKFETGFESFNNVLMSNKSDLKQELAHTFLQIAKGFLQDGAIVNNSTFEDIAARQRITQEPVEDTAGTSNPAQDDDIEVDPAEAHQMFRMVPKHVVLWDLVHEWFGTGDYYDDYGGIEGRNIAFKTRWRKLCGLNAMHYSRTERTVRAVQQYGKINKLDKYVAAERLQPQFEQCKCSITNFVAWAQDENLLEKKAARGRAKAAAAAD
jgi:hypothetical protein